MSVLDGSLAAVLAALPAPRRTASVIYPLPAVLALVVAALLAGQVSVLAMAQWAARQTPAQRETFGFPPGRTPCQTTRHRLLQHLAVHMLSALQQAALAPATPPLAAAPPAALQGVVIDGKGQRGRLRRSGASSAKPALVAYEHRLGKLNYDDAERIRELASTMPAKELAVLYRVSQSAISLILSGKRWARRHVATMTPPEGAATDTPLAAKPKARRSHVSADPVNLQEHGVVWDIEWVDADGALLGEIRGEHRDTVEQQAERWLREKPQSQVLLYRRRGETNVLVETLSSTRPARTPHAVGMEPHR